MADAAWPASVPSEPERGDYGETIQSNLSAFKPDSGPPSTWRRSTIKSTRVAATIVMSTDELDDFIAFFTDTLGDGALPFVWLNPRYAVAYRWLFDPDTQPQWESAGHDLWRVKFTAIRIGGGSVAPPGSSEGGLMIGFPFPITTTGTTGGGGPGPGTSTAGDMIGFPFPITKAL